MSFGGSGWRPGSRRNRRRNRTPQRSTEKSADRVFIIILAVFALVALGLVLTFGFLTT